MSASTMTGAAAAAPLLPSPPASRPGRPGWRDPRLALGLVLVCVSVLVGARVLAQADDTVPVLAARGPLAAGQPVTADDLVTVRLRFASSEDANRYLPAATDLTSDAVLLRPVGAGELVPRSAVGAVDDSSLVQLPLAVDPARVPASVAVGSTVDVWAASAPDEGRAGRPAARLLAGVPVLSASRPSAAAPGGLSQVVVGVPAEDHKALGRVIAHSSDGSLLVVRRPG